MTINLSSKISGLDIWAYDFARRPDKTLDGNGNPKITAYTKEKPNGDLVIPITKNPTEFTNKPVNEVRFICDNHHVLTDKIINGHGITTTINGVVYQAFSSLQNYSSLMYSNIMFVADDVYISSQEAVTRNANKTTFATQSQGINILYQTGIVQNRSGVSSIVFEIKPGYKIPVDNIIKAIPTFQNDMGQRVTGNPSTFPLSYELTAGIYLITITADKYNDWDECVIDFGSIQDTSTLPHSNVTFELSHCTVTPDETNVANGIHSWTFTAENGYVFDKNGGIENNGIIGDEIKATNTNVAKLENYDVEHDIKIVLSANRQQDPTITFVQKLKNAISNVSSALISRKLNAITLTADKGYTFQTAIQVLFYSGGKVISVYNVDGNNQESITIPLNTTKENTITDNMDDVQLIATATLATLSSGYEHNYLITDTELSSFSSEHIWNYVSNDLDNDSYNVSQYINNLIELPFKVDTITTINKISVGDIKSNVVSHEVKSRFVTLDLGKITAPYKYNNAYDYQTQTIKLYTPFVPPITIEPLNAINQTIHIVYNVDLSNGNLTINLYNDDVLFFTGTNNIASELPFLNTLKNTIINHDTHFNDNNIRQPYLVITREEPILNMDYYPTIERGVIKNYNGNVKVRLLNNMTIPNDELNDLARQLESGVKYVKSN